MSSRKRLSWALLAALSVGCGGEMGGVDAGNDSGSIPSDTGPGPGDSGCTTCGDDAGDEPDSGVELRELNRPSGGLLHRSSGPVIWEGTFRRSAGSR